MGVRTDLQPLERDQDEQTRINHGNVELGIGALTGFNHTKDMMTRIASGRVLPNCNIFWFHQKQPVSRGTTKSEETVGPPKVGILGMEGPSLFNTPKDPFKREDIPNIH